MPDKTDLYQPGPHDGPQGGTHELLASQKSIDLLTRLLQEFERRSTDGVTDLPPEVKRDIAIVAAAFESIKSALALGESPITISSVIPEKGPAGGGTRTTIVGSHFLPGATVRFGDTAATDVSVISLTKIEATTPKLEPTTPPRPAGPVDVVVVVDSLAGSASKARGYTYQP